MDVSIIIVNYKTADLLLAAIDSVFSCTTEITFDPVSLGIKGATFWEEKAAQGNNSDK